MRRFFSRISWGAVAIVCGLLLLSLCAEYFLPRKVVVVGSLICLVLCAVLLTVVVKKRRLPFAQRYGGYVVLVLVILCLAAYAGLMFSCFDYTYINGIPVLFWLLPLLCGVAVGAFVLFKWLRGKTHPAAAAGYFLLIVVVVTMATYAFLPHLNYALDFSKPEQCSSVIREKDWDHRRKGPDDYSFKVTVDGESYYIEVSRLEYERYKVGDTYRFERCSGAFGVPFFVAD